MSVFMRKWKVLETVALPSPRRDDSDRTLRIPHTEQCRERGEDEHRVLSLEAIRGRMRRLVSELVQIPAKVVDPLRLRAQLPLVHTRRLPTWPMIRRFFVVPNLERVAAFDDRRLRRGLAAVLQCIARRA